jgi:hypothetical protein
MRKIFILYSVTLFILSCDKESKTSNEKYIGDWYFEKELNSEKLKNSHPVHPYEKINFSIINDSILDFKSGFFYLIKDRFTLPDSTLEHRFSHYYLGTKTKYKIENSNIVFFNKSENFWDTIKVLDISDNKIKVKNYNGRIFQLQKSENKSKITTNEYDAIIVDRSPCFGSCPFNSTYINRNGDFYFKAYESNTVYDNYHSKLDEETLRKILMNFDKININDLKNRYSLNATDSQTNTISFIKNGEIIKTIETYIECPIDLEKAINELSFAYQKVNIKYEDNFSFRNKLMNTYFTAQNSKIYLKDSEFFLLEIELLKGKKSIKKFEEKYTLNFYEWTLKKTIKKITTDGQYFKIVYSDDTSKTIDLGYNFIEQNSIIKNNKYE